MELILDALTLAAVLLHLAITWKRGRSPINPPVPPPAAPLTRAQREAVLRYIQTHPGTGFRAAIQAVLKK